MTEFMVGLLSPLQSPLWVAPFPSSHRPPRASYFFNYCNFYWENQRAYNGNLCGGDRLVLADDVCLISS